MQCKECGKRIDGIQDRYMHGKQLEADKLCFGCDFWLEKVRWDVAGKTEHGGVPVRSKGHHYVLYPGTDHGGFGLGFGGARMKVRLASGEIIESNNVWHQGKVPSRFRDALPDNAEFIK